MSLGRFIKRSLITYVVMLTLVFAGFAALAGLRVFKGELTLSDLPALAQHMQPMAAQFAWLLAKFVFFGAIMVFLAKKMMGSDQSSSDNEARSASNTVFVGNRSRGAKVAAVGLAGLAGHSALAASTDYDDDYGDDDYLDLMRLRGNDEGLQIEDMPIDMTDSSDDMPIGESFDDSIESYGVNPANGMPMLNEFVDVEGNTFGTDSSDMFDSLDSFDNDSFSSFDDRWD